MDWRKRITRRKVSFVDMLPNEMMVMILGECTARDVGRLSMVCSLLHEITQDKLISNLTSVYSHLIYSILSILYDLRVFNVFRVWYNEEYILLYDRRIF